MKKAIIITVLTLAIAGPMAHWFYERHISADVRAAATAIVTGTVGDAPSFLHDAKMASRTRKDAEIVGALDKAVLGITASIRDDAEADRLLIDGFRIPQIPGCPVVIFVSAAQKKYCSEMIKLDMESREPDEIRMKADREAAEQERDDAMELINKVKIELHIPTST